MPSTVIRRFDYDPDAQALDVLFTTGRLYRYQDVPQAVVDEFRAAFSKGRYFNAHIRDAYDYTECVAEEAR
jgi:lysyl-tRNA synthetase class 2